MIGKKYMCTDCFTLYNQKEAESMNYKCDCREDYDGRFLVAIDEPIAESISLLNKNGYRTTSCCAGHFDKYENNIGWAEFYVEFICPLDDISFILKNVPDGLSFKIKSTVCDDMAFNNSYTVSITPSKAVANTTTIDMIAKSAKNNTINVYNEDNYNEYQKWHDEIYQFIFNKWVETICTKTESKNKK